jgi:hypothetical protein
MYKTEMKYTTQVENVRLIKLAQVDEHELKDTFLLYARPRHPLWLSTIMTL